MKQFCILILLFRDHLDEIVTGTIPADLAICCTDIALETTIGVANLDTLSCDNICSETTTDDLAITGSVFPDNDVVESAHVMTHVPDAYSSGTPEANTTPDTLCSGNINTKTTTGDSDLSDAECLDDSDVECTPDVVTFPDIVSSADIGADTPANVDAPQAADADETVLHIDIAVPDHLDEIVTGTIPADLAICCTDIALETTIGVANLDTLSCNNICSETTTDDLAITGIVFPDNDVVESAHVMTHIPDAHSSGTPEANTTPDTLCSGNINTKTTTGDSDLSDAECLDDSDVECTPDVVTFPDIVSSADIGADTPVNVDAPQAADADETVLHIDITVPDHLDEIVTGTIPADLAICCTDIALETTIGVANLDTLSCDNICSETTTDDLAITGSVFPDNDVVESAHVMTHVPDAHNSGTPEANTTPDTLCSGNINIKTTTGDSDLSDAECLDDSDVECTPDVVTFPDTVSSADIGSYTPANVDAPQAADADDTPFDIDSAVPDHLDDIVTGTISADLAMSCTDIAMESTIGVANLATLSCDNICSETTTDYVAITGSVFPDNDVVETAHVMTHVPDAHSSGTPESNTTHDTLCSGNINTKTTTGDSDLSDAECLDDSDVECTPDVVTFPDIVSSADIGADTPVNVDAPQAADADETVLHIDITVPDHLDEIVTGTIPADLAICCTDIALETTIGVANLDTLSCDNICSETTTDDLAITGSVFPDNDVVESAHVMTHVPDAHNSGTPDANTTPDTLCSGNINIKTTTGDSDLSDAECLDDSDVECTPDVVTFPDIVSSADIGADTPANVDAPQAADADETVLHIDIAVPDHLDEIVTGTIPAELAICCTDIALETTIGVANLDTLSCDNICSETTTDDLAITGSVFPDNDVVESAHVMTHVPDAHSSGTPESNTTPDTLCSGNINTKTTTGDSDLSDAECLDDSDVECTPDVVTFPDIVSSADIGADTPVNVDAPQAADADEAVLHIDITVPDHLDEIVTGTIPADLAICCTDIALETTIGVANLDTLSCDNICSETTTDDLAITGSVFPDNDVVESAHVMTHVPDAHSSGTPEANTTPDTLCSGNINIKTTTGDSDLSDAECLDDSDVECTPDVVTFPDIVSSADIGADTPANVDAPQAADADETVLHIDIAVPDHLDEIVTGTIPAELAICCTDIALETTIGVANLDTLSCDNICSETTTDDLAITGSVFPDNDVVESAHVMTHVPDAHSSGTPESNTTPDALCSGNINTKTTTGDSDLSDAECLDDSDVECTPDVVTFPDTVSSADIGAATHANVDAPQAADADETVLHIDIAVPDHLDEIVTGTIPADLAISCTDIALETTIGVANLDTLSCDNICSETTTDDLAITGSVFPDNDVVESAYVMTHVPDAHSSGTPEANNTPDTLCSGNINTKTTTGDSDLSDAECLDDSDVECAPDVVTFPDIVSSADIGAYTPANVDAPQAADADDTPFDIDIAVPDNLDDIVTGTISADLAMSCTDIAMESTIGVANLATLSCDNICSETTTDDLAITGSVFPDHDVAESAHVMTHVPDAHSSGTPEANTTPDTLCSGNINIKTTTGDSDLSDAECLDDSDVECAPDVVAFLDTVSSADIGSYTPANVDAPQAADADDTPFDIDSAVPDHLDDIVTGTISLILLFLVQILL